MRLTTLENINRLKLSANNTSVVMKNLIQICVIKFVDSKSAYGLRFEKVSVLILANLVITVDPVLEMFATLTYSSYHRP